MRQVQTLPALLGPVSEWMETIDVDGNFYWANSKTGEAIWNEPPEHLDFLSELDALAQLADVLGEDWEHVDPDVANDIATAFGHIPRGNRRAFERLLPVLASISKSPKLAEKLALNPAMANLGAVMAANPDQTAILASAASALDAMLQHTAFKQQLDLFEYHVVLTNTTRQHLATESLVCKCMSILSSLAFHNDTSAAYHMQLEIPRTIASVIDMHASSCAASGNFNCLLHCVTDMLYITANHQNEFKQVVAQVAGPSIVTALKTLKMLAKTAPGDNLKGHPVEDLVDRSSVPPHVDVVIQLLANISLADDTVLPLLGLDVVGYTVRAMQAFPGEVPVLQHAIQFFANLGAAMTPEAHDEAVAYIIDHGALKQMKIAMGDHDSQVELLSTTMDALLNICSNSEAAEEVVKLGIMDIVVDQLTRLDYERHLILGILVLLETLTMHESSVHCAARINLAQPLALLADRYLDDIKMVVPCVTVFFNIAADAANRKNIIVSNGIPLLLRMLELYMDHDFTAKAMVST